MTREEAIAKASSAILRFDNGYDDVELLVDRLIALGLLKPEKSKTVEDEAKEYLEGYGHGASYLLFLLQKGGFKIVRET